MNVMYACDNNYAEIMAVSILSLLKKNQDFDEIVFYIVIDNVSKENIKKLRELITRYHRSVNFIENINTRSITGVDLLTLRWSDSAYSRLFLKEIFGSKPSVDKLLYLDCDTIVVSSLRKLWDTDVSEYLGAACLECMSRVHKKIVGADKDSNYINSGMMLFNVKKWIEEDIQSKCIDFIRKYKGKTEYVDQGVINGTVSNQLKLVSPRYNLTALAYDFTYEEMQIYRKPDFGYTKDEWMEAVDDPAIVHFTTSFLSIRPWYEGSKHPYAEMWKEFHDETPWKNEPYRKLENREVRDKKEAIYRKLPRCIAVHGAGFLHAYVKPLVYVLKMNNMKWRAK